MVRLKNRYVVVAFRSHSETTSKTFLQAIRESVQELFGDVGYGKMLYSLAVKYWSPLGNLAILRVSRSQLRPLLGCMAILPAKFAFKTDVQVIHVGGTIRTCKKFLLKYADTSAEQRNTTAP